MRIGLLHSREWQGDSGAECFGHPYHDRRGSERPGKWKQQTGECRHQEYWNHTLQPSSEFGTESVPVSVDQKRAYWEGKGWYRHHHTTHRKLSIS